MVREVTIDSIRTPARPAASTTRSYIPVASSSRLPIPARSTVRKRAVLGESDLDNLTPKVLSTSTTKRKLGAPARSRFSQTKKSTATPVARQTRDMDMTSTFNFGAGDQTMLMDVQPPSSVSGFSSPPEEPTRRFNAAGSKFVRGSRIGESRMMTPLPSQEMQQIHAPSPSDNTTPRISRLPTPPSSSPEERSSATKAGSRIHTRPEVSPERSMSSLPRVERISPNPRRKNSPRLEPRRSGAKSSLGSPLLPSDQSSTPRTTSRVDFTLQAPSTARGPKRSSTSYLTPSTLGTPREIKGKQRAIPSTAPAGIRKPRQSTSRKSPPRTVAKAVAAKRRNSTPHVSGSRRKSVTPMAALALSGRKLGFLEEKIPIEPGEDPLLLKGPEEDEVCRWPRMSTSSRKKLEDMTRARSGERDVQAGPSTLKRGPPSVGNEVRMHPAPRHSPALRSDNSPRQSSPQHGIESGLPDFDMGDDHFDVPPFDAPDAWDSGASDGEIDESHVGQDTFLHVLERNGAATSTPRRTTQVDDQSRLLSISPIIDTTRAHDYSGVGLVPPNLPVITSREPSRVDFAMDEPASPAPSVGQPEYNNDFGDDSDDDNHTVADDTVIVEEESFFGSSATTVVQNQDGDSLESLEEVDNSMQRSLDSSGEQVQIRGKVDCGESGFDEDHSLASDMVHSSMSMDRLDETAPTEIEQVMAGGSNQSPLRRMNSLEKVILDDQEGTNTHIDVAPTLDESSHQALDRQAPGTPEMSFKSERSLRLSSSRTSFTYELDKGDVSAQDPEGVELVYEQDDSLSKMLSQESVDESLLDTEEPIALQEISMDRPTEITSDATDEDDGDEDEEEAMLNDPSIQSARDSHSPDMDDDDDLEEDRSTGGVASGDVTMEADSAEWDMSEPDESEETDRPCAGIVFEEKGEDKSLEVEALVIAEPDADDIAREDAMDDLPNGPPESEGLDVQDPSDVVMTEPNLAEESASHSPRATLAPSIEDSGSHTENSVSSATMEPSLSTPEDVSTTNHPSGGATLDPQSAHPAPEKICLRLIYKSHVKVEPAVPAPDNHVTFADPPLVGSGSDQETTTIRTQEPAVDATANTNASQEPVLSAELLSEETGVHAADASFESNTSTASSGAIDTPTPSPTADTARPIRPLPPVFPFPRNNSPRGVTTSPIELMHSSRVKQPSRLSQFVTASTTASPDKGTNSAQSMVGQGSTSSTSGTTSLGTATSIVAFSPVSSVPPPAAHSSPVTLSITHASTGPDTSIPLGLTGMEANKSTSSSGDSSSYPARSAASSSFRSLADEMATSSSGGMTSWHPFDSSLIEVSSLDPRAAARAAAILKMNHAYIQDGILPSTPSAASIPLPMTPSTSTSARGRRRTPRPFESPFFETIELSQRLNEEELLHEAELEIVASRRHRSRSRGRSTGPAEGYVSDGTEINLPGGWLSSAKKRKRSLSTVRPAEKQPDAGNTAPNVREQRPWGVKEWKKLERFYRSERKAWERDQVISASPSTSWLSWASNKLSAVSGISSEWDSERVVKRFIEIEKAHGGVGEWAEETIRLRIKALEKRVNKKAAKHAGEEDEHAPKRRRIDVQMPHETPDVDASASVAPPSTIQRMFSSFWTSTSRSSLAETPISVLDTVMSSGQSLQAIISKPICPPLSGDTSALDDERVAPVMKQAGGTSATMSRPVKFQPAHPSSPAWSPALPVPGAMPRSPRRRPPPLDLPTPIQPAPSGPSEAPKRSPVILSPARTPVSLHAASSTPNTRTKPLYPPLYPALSKRSEPVRTLFETPSSKPTSSVPVPITIPRGRIPSPSVKELARSFEDEGVLNRLYKGKEKEMESALRRVQSREL